MDRALARVALLGLVGVLAGSAAPHAAAASRSANLSVVATVVTSCASAPSSLLPVCTRGGPTQIDVTPVAASAFSAFAFPGSFFGVRGPMQYLGRAQGPLVGTAAPTPFVTSEPAGTGTLAAPEDDGASDTFLVTVNF